LKLVLYCSWQCKHCKQSSDCQFLQFSGTLKLATQHNNIHEAEAIINLFEKALKEKSCRVEILWHKTGYRVWRINIRQLFPMLELIHHAILAVIEKKSTGIFREINYYNQFLKL